MRAAIKVSLARAVPHGHSRQLPAINCVHRAMFSAATAPQYLIRVLAMLGTPVPTVVLHAQSARSVRTEQELAMAHAHLVHPVTRQPAQGRQLSRRAMYALLDTTQLVARRVRVTETAAVTQVVCSATATHQTAARARWAGTRRPARAMQAMAVMLP
jgi:hypothetical protein